VLHWGDVVTVTLLYFDDCPNWGLADQRTRQALLNLGHRDTLVYETVSTIEEAERRRFRGSPTILIDGHDPFARESDPVGLSCRLYHTESGTEPSPSIRQLEWALSHAE
jgi:hypothetical protein